jgi:hypothetical protein
MIVTIKTFLLVGGPNVLQEKVAPVFNESIEMRGGRGC